MEEIYARNEEASTGQQFAELLCDFMFKRLFGSEANKDVLIGFLNMLLEDVEIVDVDFIPTEHLGLSDEDRKVIFDISCRCADGRTFIIEMQKGSDLKFEWNYDLKPVTVVSILNFKFDHEEGWPQDRYHSSYRLREDSCHEVMTDVLRFVFLELGRFKKRIWELHTVFDKWMYLLKHMHEMVAIPKEFGDPLFTRLFLLAKINNFTSDEFKQYKKSLENMSDWDNIINSTEERAEIRGREAGRAENALKVAKEMLADDMPIDKICKYTGLSVEQIEALKD